jgi:hypothetical protein
MYERPPRALNRGWDNVLHGVGVVVKHKQWHDHLASILLQTEAQVSARCHDLMKQGAHVLGIACGKHPTRMVGQKLGVADGGHALTPHRVALVLNGDQGNGDVTENRQVALTELREGPVGSPIQSVVEVVTPSRGKPSRHGRVGGVSQNVHIDLAAPQPKLTVRTAMVCGEPCVAEAVQHVPEQGGKHPLAPRVS